MWRIVRAGLASKGFVMDGAVDRALADGLRLHIAWRVGLVDVWDQVEKVLGRRVMFLTVEQREELCA